MSQLYLASSVLKYYYDNNKPNTDIDYVCWALQECLRKIQIAIDEVLNNFPKRWVGKLLSWIVFPYGQAYRNPNDKLHANIVSFMLAPSEFRNRVTQYSYLTDNETELGYRLEKALANADVIDPLWKKLHKAVVSGVIPKQYDFDTRIKEAQKINVLSAEEALMLSEFEALRAEIIKVNEFSFDLSKVIA
jgi:hypothetical protein